MDDHLPLTGINQSEGHSPGSFLHWLCRFTLPPHDRGSGMDLVCHDGVLSLAWQGSRRNPAVWTNVRDVDGFGRSSTTPAEPQVSFVAFSFDASWMVTLEVCTAHLTSHNCAFSKYFGVFGGSSGAHTMLM